MNNGPELIKETMQGIKEAVNDLLAGIYKEAGAGFIADHENTLIEYCGRVVTENGGNLLLAIYAEDMAREKINEIKEVNNDR